MLIGPEDPRPVHFMGVAGAGMNALAELFARRGVVVSGCDLSLIGCENLLKLGISVSQGHDPLHLAGARALVVSSAVSRTHPEVEEANRLGLPVVRRAEALAAAVSGGQLVGIAGTHGKTTTSVMTTLALASAGLAPTGVVGGRVGDWGGNLFPGDNRLFVVEADEYDRSFLALHPEIAVITNVEADHLDIYRDLSDVKGAFREFASRARVAVLCADDPGARDLPTGAAHSVLYGVRGAQSQSGQSGPIAYEAVDVVFEGRGCSFGVFDVRNGRRLGEAALQVPGLHNVRNALAAIAVGLELGAPFEALAAGLSTFRGVERRFELVGEAAGVAVVDDYAHHPTEIRATIDAARRVYPGRRLICAFQPHLYSRTRDFAPGFGDALAQADMVLLTEIYPAREQPIAGVDSGLIEAAIRAAGGSLQWRGARDDLAGALERLAAPGDVVFTIGAGDVTRSARELLELLRSRQ